MQSHPKSSAEELDQSSVLGRESMKLLPRDIPLHLRTRFTVRGPRVKRELEEVAQR